ncbi:hypothetical protein FQ087_03530 [Sporosarcina sp. ANT_H38]|uniref:hypothetical protein n=1 Tax=Sporosarcina sp. ANT_H38 TaxID=2597358 RepID=UPI0011F183C5|nr:hypothetical protein [Sporosarcina sp. ANT_H38]KAA0965391.1 hypothetical protein FQ087_03530 [Sporosarcina sp. ANT_H38]
MELIKNKYFIGVSWILAIFLLVVSFLVISISYFNTKEIRLLTSGCYENSGEVIIEIHNNLTNEYSFECK